MMFSTRTDSPRLSAQRSAQGGTIRRSKNAALLVAAVSLAALSVAVVPVTGCNGGGEKKPTTDTGVTAKLRRVEVVSSTFSEMQLRVIVALNNPGQGEVKLSGGDVEIQIAGKAQSFDQDGNDIEDEAEEETEEDASDDEGTAGEEEAEEEGEAEEEEEEEQVEEGVVDTSDGEGIIDGAWHKGAAEVASVPAYAQSEVAINVTLPLPTAPDALERLLLWERMYLQIKGTLALGGNQETFAGRREIGLPVLPKVLLQGAQISSIDGGLDGEAYLTLEIDNPNPFEVSVDQFAWGAEVGGKEMRKMSEATSETVPPSSRLQSEDTIKLNDETFGKEVRKLLRKPTVPYRINGFYEVRGIRKEFTFDGEMAFAR